MSALALVVLFVIAIVAAMASALVDGGWAARTLGARFVFALAILILPSLIH